MSSKRRLLSACGATLLASGLLSQYAQADLLIDLRTPTGTPTGAKAANVPAGSVFNLDVYAKITLTTGNAETTAAFQELQGSFLSAPGATNFLGTIAPAGGTCCGLGAVTVVGISPFTDTGTVPGSSADLDADTDLDLGHANADAAAGFTFIRDDRPNKASTQGAGYVGTVLDANNVEWKIGRISFTADAAAPAGATTNVNFAFRRGSTGAISESTALWFESTGTKTGLNGTLTVGAPVVLTAIAGGPPQWNVNADGNWSDSANWQGGVPNGAAAVANFLGKITAAHTVTLDGSRQVQEVHFDNPNKYTIAQGSGTLTVGNGTTGTIEVVQGTHEIASALALSGNVSKTGAGTLRISGSQSHSAGSALGVSAGTLQLASDAGTAATGAAAATARLALSITGNGGKTVLSSSQTLKELTISTANAGTQGLDLASAAPAGSFNGVRVYATDLAGTKTALNAAVANARTNIGDGIYDSNLHANMAIGVATVNDAHGDPSVFVRATRVGDLNLDGTTTIADFVALASHFNQPGGWQEGDVNFDGLVTIADFVALASNFNQSYTGETWPISASDEQLLSSFAASVGAAVPEPGTVGMILVGAFGLLGRRRRGR